MSAFTHSDSPLPVSTFLGLSFHLNLSSDVEKCRLFSLTLPLYYLKKLFGVAGVQNVPGYHEPSSWFLWMSFSPEHIFYSLSSKKENSVTHTHTQFLFFVISLNVLVSHCLEIKIIKKVTTILHLVINNTVDSRKRSVERIKIKASHSTFIIAELFLLWMKKIFIFKAICA